MKRKKRKKRKIYIILKETTISTSHVSIIITFGDASVFRKSTLFEGYNQKTCHTTGIRNVYTLPKQSEFEQNKQNGIYDRDHAH
jgi:hypothetical protein